MTLPVLNTARLALRPTGPEFFDGLWAAIQSSLRELSPWMPWAIDPEPESIREFLLEAAREWESGRERHFTICLDDKPSGHCALDHVDPWGHGCEISYWLRSDLCGKGLVTEAASAVIGYAFREERFHRIQLKAGTENVASNRVAEKLGFRKEGVLRHAGLGSHGYHDTNIYGLLLTDL